TRVSVWLGDFAIRCHGRRTIPGVRTNPYREAHGGARLAHGRPRSRVQQHLHLREFTSTDARRENPFQRARERFLRAGAESFRRRAGRAVESHFRRFGIHLLVQWPAFAIHRYAALAAVAGGGASTRPSAHGRAGRKDLFIVALALSCADDDYSFGLLRRRTRRV